VSAAGAAAEWAGVRRRPRVKNEERVPMKWWFRQKLHIQIFVCIGIGVLLGVVFGERVSVIQPLGTVFIRLLKMLVVPLTFLTLIAGMTKLDGIKALRSLGGLTLLFYGVSSIVAGGIGMGLALIMMPGKGLTLETAAGATAKPAEFDFADSVVQWVPTNPIEAFASTNMLQVIFFALIVGITMLALGKKAERLVALANDGADLMICITEAVMKVAPYGILALVANMTASLKADVLGEVGKFILTQQTALLILLVVFYPLAIRFIGRLNPWRFYRNVSPAMLVAASTTSSAATLPVSMDVAEENLGAPEKVWGFTLPLGATINMNGLASCLGVIAVFSYNVYDLPITPGLMLRFLFLSLALSVGCAGVKGAGIVTSAIMLQAIDVPTAVIVPILAAIWPVLDIGNTCCNVTGDLVATAVLANRLGMLDKDIFNETDGRCKGGPADRPAGTDRQGPPGPDAAPKGGPSEGQAG
jgi:Na+/H+-dicarboxylate symporter